MQLLQTRLLKQSLKTLKMLKELEMQSISVFLGVTKVADCEKTLISAELKGCAT